MLAFFLSSGLFLGWSLGANHLSNVFGTAVGSGMIRFRTAAVLCSIFIILGAVISGAGASATLSGLGRINTVPGAFMVALAAAVTVYLMTVVGHPVSTSQAIVGAIIGWNFFSASITDYDSLIKIATTWVASPILSAVLAILLYKAYAFVIRLLKIHMFKLDGLNRYGLIIAGVFGSYSLGANNIANVMGVFLLVYHFADVSLFGLFTLTSDQQLFFLGGLAIAVGVLTYSRRVTMTVGKGILELSPAAALVVVWAHSLVLFLFASEDLRNFLQGMGLPAFPLVPVCSSQAIVGAAIGVGLLKGGGRTVKWRTVLGITRSWIITPVAAALISFICLFFLQNVFQQNTYHPVRYELNPLAMQRLKQEGLYHPQLEKLRGKEFPNAVAFAKALKALAQLNQRQLADIMRAAELADLVIHKECLEALRRDWLSPEQFKALVSLSGRQFSHKWLLAQALAEASPSWRPRPGDEQHNRQLQRKLARLYMLLGQQRPGT